MTLQKNKIAQVTTMAGVIGGIAFSMKKGASFNASVLYTLVFAGVGFFIGNSISNYYE
ncbi:MAG: hypothetical protein RLY43_931 [Bacteroidota bacterium]|jgi:hypothetical protein